MNPIRDALLVVFASLFACGSLAQTAPAGNAHPDAPVVDAEAEIVNPFGDPEFGTPTTPEDKHAFSEMVDLSPLADLAVFHAGRVKIISTLADETVENLTGRHRFDEFAETADGVRQFKYDPLFTFFDLLIEPGDYLRRPLIAIDYLPLRREILRAEFPGDERLQERWLKTTRVSPAMLLARGDAMWEKHAFDAPMRESLEKADAAMGLFRFGTSNLKLIVPDATHEQWIHLGSLPPEAPSRIAAMDMATAWRARDVGAVNTAAQRLADSLLAINPDAYPTSRRSLEMAYNNTNAFQWGYWLYALSFVMLLLGFGTGRSWIRTVGAVTLFAGVGLHAFGFTLRCIIAERFAIQNQFESMIGISLLAAIVGLGLTIARKQWLFGAATAGVGFLILITATETGIPGRSIEREAAILNTSVLLKYHVTTVLASYGLIALGFIISLFYLGVHYAQKLGGTQTALAGGALGYDEEASAGPARTLADLDKAQMTVLQLAFWTLGVGILLGAWWADHSWGRWWAFDPKETWALITWIIYLIVIHVRFGVKNRALVTAWLSVLGFIVMLWTYFGVNLLLPGLHAYA